MELKEVDIIRPQAAQTLLNMAEGRGLIRGGALGGDHHILPDTLQSLTQFLLTVRIGVGGIEVVDARVHGTANQAHRVGPGNSLDGQGTEGGLGDMQFRAAQSDFLHIPSS